MNIGHSSKLQYDSCFYPDRVSETVSPGEYRLQEYSTYNQDSCFAPFGVRSSFNGAGVSTVAQMGPAMAQRLVDVDSNLSNRHLPQSRCREGRVNLTDVSKLKNSDRPNCNSKLAPEYSHITSTPKNFRDVQINRFYNLKKNPQDPIFYDFAINTTLEAKDNYVPIGPRVLEQQAVFPVEDCKKSPYTLQCLSIPERYI
jgi:hypothetical protein